MGLFGRRQETPAEPEPTLLAMIADLQARVAAAESRVRTCETEQAHMHDEVRKWMRRAEAAERRTVAVRDGNQEPRGPEGEHTASVTPRPRRLWGARARIAARRARLSAEEQNGSGAESAEEE